MIELAPHHKIGLPIKKPLLPAAGFFGYTFNHYKSILEADMFGALVTNPITLRPGYHQNTPAFAETTGGLIVNTSPANPGVKKVIREAKKVWQRLNTPVLAHLPADEPSDLARAAGVLTDLDLVAGFELGLPPQFDELAVKAWLGAIFQRSELPIFAKIALNTPLTSIETLLSLGIDGLVLGHPPQGGGFTPTGNYLTGAVYGLGQVTQVLPHLVEIKKTFPEATLIASGGVHTLQDVKTYLAGGASAVQIDSLIFSNPLAVEKICRAWA